MASMLMDIVLSTCHRLPEVDYTFQLHTHTHTLTHFPPPPPPTHHTHTGLPADIADVRVNDRIVEVESTEVTRASADQVVDIVRSVTTTYTTQYHLLIVIYSSIGNVPRCSTSFSNEMQPRPLAVPPHLTLLIP